MGADIPGAAIEPTGRSTQAGTGSDGRFGAGGAQASLALPFPVRKLGGPAD